MRTEIGLATFAGVTSPDDMLEGFMPTTCLFDTAVQGDILDKRIDELVGGVNLGLALHDKKICSEVGL